MRIGKWAVGMGLVISLAWGLALAQDPAVESAPAGGGNAESVPLEPEPVTQVTLLELLLKGGALMYPLGLCSIVMVAFVIERGLALRRSQILPADTQAILQNALRGPEDYIDAKALHQQLELRSDPLARVAIAGLRKAHRTIQEIEKAIEDAGAKEAGVLRRNCRVLSMGASIAPLLGLTGTVTGMIKSFMTVAARAEALGRTELLAAGIYEALVTTAVGLAIAIPSLVFYYYYIEKVESFVVELDSLAEELVDKIPTRG